LGFTVPPFAHGFGPIHVWSGEKTIERILPGTSRWENAESSLHILEAFQPVTLADGTYVMPLKAAHDPN
jgi:hypothetical protein